MAILVGALQTAVKYLFSSESNQERFEQRFGTDPQALSVYNEYFSAYQNSSLKLEPDTLARVDQILQRKELGGQIARQWERILLGGERPTLDATKRAIPNENLLREAVATQFVFENCLLKEKEIDRYQRICHERILPELKLLRRYQGFWGYLCFRLSESEKALIEELKEKSERFHIPFKNLVQNGISEREALYHELQKKIKESQCNYPSLERFEKEYQAALHLRREPIEESLLHRSIQNRAVVAIGDPILEDARFLIVERPREILDDMWEEMLCNDASAYRRDEDNQLLYADIEWPYHRGEVRFSFEPARRALRLHEDRDFGQKVRRVEIEPGRFERTSTVDETNWLQNGWRDLWNKGWSQTREETNIDHHESISVARSMIAHVLKGNAPIIPQNTAQNLGEYIDAISRSDVAKLPGGSLESPVFLQMQSTYQLTHEHFRKFYMDLSGVSSLEVGLDTEYRAKYDRPRVALLSRDLFESYSHWHASLELFLEELNRSPKVKKDVGPHLVEQLSAFKEILYDFIANAPKPILELLNMRKEAMQNYPGSVDKLDEAEKVWRGNRTTEEMDEILESAIDHVNQWNEQLTQSLVLISAPLSSPYMQRKITKKMDPDLAGLYQKAIPPFWQNKAKISILLKEILKGTELSPLWFKVTQALAGAEAELIKSEFIRSRLAKQIS